MVLDAKKLQRGTFYQHFPITVSPATRHQAFICKNVVPMKQGDQFTQRRGSSIFVQKVCVTATVSSDLFARKQIRTLRPTLPSTETHTSLNPENQLLVTTNIDADFTGFKATVVGITVPVEGEQITQDNNTILPRCTLTQPDIASGFSVGYPTQHFLTSTTVTSDAPAYTFPSQVNALECPYRTMLFVSDETPRLDASVPAQFLPYSSTYTPYDPAFSPYLAYIFHAPYLDDINSQITQYEEQYQKMGPSLTNVHQYEMTFENPLQLYYGNVPGAVTPTRGGLFFLVVSDVNVGYSETLNPEVYQNPERLNTRWLVTICTEVFYYD